MKRRTFIQQSSAVILGTASLGISSYSNFEPVRVAVVGTGGRGTDLIRKLSTIERANIVAVCDNYPPHLKGGLEAAGSQAKAYTDYATMLKEIQPQAVVIATPLYLHYDMAVHALEAGCDVFCEKTMCYSQQQANELKNLVHERQAVFQVGLQRRANAIYRQASAMVDTGMLGQITAIKCQWHRNNNWRRPVPVEKKNPAWDRLEKKLNWRLYKLYSHGLMTELASHQLDVVNWLLGTTPESVMGSGGIDYWRDGREVYDNVFCIYNYEKLNESGDPYTVRVTYSSLQNNAYEGASELVMGTKGTLFLTSKKGLFYQEGSTDNPGWSNDNQSDKNAVLVTSGKTLKMDNDPWAHRGKPFEIDATANDTRDELIAFLDCVQRRDTQTICDVHVGWDDTMTVLAGVQAMEEHTIVNFPAGQTH